MSLNTTKWAWFESFGRKGVPNKAKFRKHGNTEPRGGPPVPQGPERKGSPQLIEPEDIVNFEGSRRRDDWDGQEYRGGGGQKWGEAGMSQHIWLVLLWLTEPTDWWVLGEPGHIPTCKQSYWFMQRYKLPMNRQGKRVGTIGKMRSRL